MFDKIKTIFRTHFNPPNITVTVSGIVKDYTVAHELPGTILILENEDKQTGRYHIDRHVHYVRQEHPIGSRIRLQLPYSKPPANQIYMAQVAD